MDTGLSDLQKAILRLAYQNRYMAERAYYQAWKVHEVDAGPPSVFGTHFEHTEWRATKGADVQLHHVLREIYGFPRWSADRQAGDAKYDSAKAATKKALDSLVAMGLLEQRWGRYRLTEEGLVVANRLLAESRNQSRDSYEEKQAGLSAAIIAGGDPARLTSEISGLQSAAAGIEAAIVAQRKEQEEKEVAKAKAAGEKRFAEILKRVDTEAMPLFQQFLKLAEQAKALDTDYCQAMQLHIAYDLAMPEGTKVLGEASAAMAKAMSQVRDAYKGKLLGLKSWQ